MKKALSVFIVLMFTFGFLSDAAAFHYTGADGILEIDVPDGITVAEGSDGYVYLFEGETRGIPYVTVYSLKGVAEPEEFIARMASGIAASLDERAGFRTLSEPYEVIFGGRTVVCADYSYNVGNTLLLDTRLVLMENGSTYVFSLVEVHDDNSELSWLVRHIIMGLGVEKTIFQSDGEDFSVLIPGNVKTALDPDTGLLSLYASEKGSYPYVTISKFPGYDDPAAFLDSYKAVLYRHFASNSLSGSEMLTAVFNGYKTAYMSSYYTVNEREIEQYTFAVRAGEGIYLISGLSVQKEYLNSRVLLNSILESFTIISE